MHIYIGMRERERGHGARKYTQATKKEREWERECVGEKRKVRKRGDDVTKVVIGVEVIRRGEGRDGEED